MRSVTVGLVSFVLGFVVAVAGIHTSTWAQALVSVPDAIPKVPDVLNPFVANEANAPSYSQQIDGLACKDSVFNI